MTTMATDTTINGTGSTVDAFGTYKTSGKGSSSSSTTSTTDSSKSSTTSSLQSLNQNFDQFLGMLTTQMKNQDPLNPMDSNQMTSQLVQFAMAEQAIGTNSRLDKLVKMQESTTMTNNLYYLNRAVQYEGTEFDYVEGMSSADLSYKLDRDAKSVNIDILNSSGTVVKTLKGEVGGGAKQDVAWDFTNTKGEKVPAGEYSFKVTPKGQNDDDYIKYTPYTFAVVTGVDFNSSGDAILRSGNRTVAVSKVMGVY
jgi:flagellar basal-body rod modification protein FlgD